MERVSVLVVGGGGAGLTASMLLATQGVDHLLVSSRPGTSDLPKAHVLNLRAMEILEEVGVADAIEEVSTPAEAMATSAFYAGFAGDDPDDGRRIAKLQSWGGGGADESWSSASPKRQCNLPQIRLEPLLKRRAEELSPGRIRFNHELFDLREGDGLVTDEQFTAVFGQSMLIIVGSITAFLVSQLIDVTIFHFFKNKTGDKMIWLRSTGSTVISQLFDSFIVLGIAFWLPGKMDNETFLLSALTGYSVKLGIAILLTPLIYLGHSLIEKYIHGK